MEILRNIYLLSLALMITVTVILGFTVYINNRKSITSQTFLLFSLITVLWGIINYSYYFAVDANLSFILLRVVITLAIWHSFSFFVFAYTFPENEMTFPKSKKYIMLSAVLITSLMNLSSVTFKRALLVSASGQVMRVEYGPGMIVFILLVLFFVCYGIFLIFKKTFSNKYSNFKKQFTLLLVGIFLTFLLIITFNLILPVFFFNTTFIPFGALFIFPFIACTAYAICRHHLFGIKLITIEFATFILWIMIATHIPFAKDAREVFVEVNLLVITIIFCATIIYAILHEMRQHEKYQKLIVDLSKAYKYIHMLEHPMNEKVFGLSKKEVDEIEAVIKLKGKILGESENNGTA